MSMASPPKMIMSGTTRMVVNSRMLPRWSRSQRPIMAILPPSPLATELDRLDVLPRDVDAALRRGAPQQHRSQVHVVGVDSGAVGQDHGGRGPRVRARDVRRQRAVLHR